MRLFDILKLILKQGLKFSIINYFMDHILSKVSVLKIFHFIAGLKLRKQSFFCKELTDFYELVNKFTFVPLDKQLFTIRIRMAQKKKEFLDFLIIANKINPKNILEIGTFDGGTIFLLSKISDVDAKLISIDLPIYKRDSGYAPYRLPLYRFFNIANQKLYFIRDNSHGKNSINKVKSILKEEKLDLLFIDGDHSYNGVKKDFYAYYPFVKINGLIAFHDIIDHPKELNCEVSKLWNEIKNDFKTIELIENNSEKWGGIGIIQKTQNIN
ncbi:MAG: class I SAM-dependent methyltransferase [Promethearchaeia archaeon]